MNSLGWKKVRIKDITEINPESISNKTSQDTVINYIDLESVKAGKILGVKELLFEDAPSRAKRLVRKDDVLFSTVRPYLKNFTIINEEKKYLVASTGFAVLRAKDNSDSKFIYQVLYSDLFMNQIISEMKGSNYPAVNASDVEKVEILLPTLKEQQKIAEILSTVDTQIEQTEQLIEKTKELKTGLMQQLLTKGIEHSEFKGSELGEIPLKWDVKLLGECLKIFNGYAFKSTNKSEDGIPWLKIANVGVGRIKWEERAYLPVDFKGEYSTYLISQGDIVMAMTRPILNGKLKVAIYNEKYQSLLNQRVCSFKFESDASPLFFYYVLSSPKFAQKLEYLIAGTDPPNVSPNQVHKLSWAIPPLEEQQKIAEILSTVDSEIESYEQEKSKYEELKKGLMQQLLTGKIRVMID